MARNNFERHINVKYTEAFFNCYNKLDDDIISRLDKQAKKNGYTSQNALWFYMMFILFNSLSKTKPEDVTYSTNV